MSRGATVPVYSSKRSDSVVLPWSTCAMTEIARVRCVGVDTKGVYRAQMKRPALSGPAFSPTRRLRLRLHVGSEVRGFELFILSLSRGLRIGLGRVDHRFAAADVFAFEGRVLDHRSPPCG